MLQLINFWAVLVAAVVSMAIGSIWYGPLFGKKFSEAMGMANVSPEQMAEMKRGMWRNYLWQFISSMVMFYALAWLVVALAIDAIGGLEVAFWIWLGFIVPLKLSDAVWGGKMVLFWINVGNMLVTLLAAGAILGAWR